MKLQTLMIAAAAVLMAFSALPAEAMHPDCSASNVQCKTIAGPASIEVKDVVSAGVGLCQNVMSGPLFCDLATGNGISAAGAANFDASGFATGSNRAVNVWIQYNQDVHPCTAALLVCGFSALACNDRDLSTDCTNIDAQFDQLWNLYSNNGVVGDDCSTPDHKDDKDCGNPAAANRDVCMEPATDGSWNVDQIVVFVGSWVGGDPTVDNFGAGVSVGTFDVTITDNGASSCTDSTGTTASNGCLWQNDAVDQTLLNIVTSGALDDLQALDPVTAVGKIAASPQVSGTDTCRDANGVAATFTCGGTSVGSIVVFVIGVGHSTATGSCVSGGSVTASVLDPIPTLNPVNTAPIASATGTFSCNFGWTVFAVGGCLAV